MRSILLILLCTFFGFNAPAQSEADQLSQAKSIYFLIDASGTMQEWREEAKSKLNAKKTLLSPNTQVSVSFFGQEPSSSNEVVDCGDPVLISDPVPRFDEVVSFPKLGRDEDTTAIGQALLAALRVAGESSQIVLITDGNDECDSDFNSIRRSYPNALIEIFQVGDAPNTALELLELFNSSVVASNTVELPTPLIIDFPDEESAWEKANPLARWNWLIGIGIMFLAVIGFGTQQGLRAHVLEVELKSLREEKRKTQDGKLDIGVSETHHQRAQTKLKKFGNTWPPFTLFLIGLVWIGALTFGPDSHFRVSREIAWLVLSSSFAVVFSVFTSTPIFFAMSQYWRSMQVKHTFDDEVDATKVAELQQQRAENARSYRMYEKLRKTIDSTKFSSPWPTGTTFDRDSQDREAFAEVANEAARIAVKVLLPEDDPSAISTEIERLNRYKVDGWSRPRLEDWIKLLYDDHLISSQSWSELANSISSGEFDTIRANFRLVLTEIQSSE